jgi:hypothetical protein
MAAHGYFFPIDDHMLTVKNDNTFYRFQVRLHLMFKSFLHCPNETVMCPRNMQPLCILCKCYARAENTYLLGGSKMPCVSLSAFPDVKVLMT